MIDARERVTGRSATRSTWRSRACSTRSSCAAPPRTPGSISVDVSRARSPARRRGGPDRAGHPRDRTDIQPVFRPGLPRPADPRHRQGPLRRRAGGGGRGRRPRHRRARRSTLIEVEYEELPAVFDVDAALADGAPLVHEEPPRLGPDLRRHDRPTRARAPTSATTSSCARATSRPASPRPTTSSRTRSRSPPVQHVPLETHACVAGVTRRRRHDLAPRPRSRTSSARQLAEMFRLPQSRVRVIVPDPGRRLRRQVLPEDRADHGRAVARSRAGRCRLHLTREEEFVTITKHGVRIRMKTGLDARRHDRRPQEHVPLQHRRLRRHRPAAHQERRLRHRRAAPHPATSGSTRTPSTRTCRPPARSAATASARRRGRTRPRWT